MSGTERDYHLSLALHCLCCAGESTASELLEVMGTAALEAGHPREALPVTVAAVQGLLRDLDRRGDVVRVENRPSPRDGRPVAVWAITAGNACGGLPAPPHSHLAAAGNVGTATAGLQPRGGLSSAQSLAFLEVEFQGLLDQMEREHVAAQARARREFDAFRVRVAKIMAITEAEPA